MVASNRTVPINIQRQDSTESPSSSKPGTPLPVSNVYMKHMKPFSPNQAEDNSENSSRIESPEPLSEGRGSSSRKSDDRQRRVSRFLRPDFYETPKEDSIYAKMKELEDEDKKKPRFLRVVQQRKAMGESSSGRNTPLDANFQSEDRSNSGSQTPQPDIMQDMLRDQLSPPSEGQLLNRALTLKRQTSLREPAVAPTSPRPPLTDHSQAAPLHQHHQHVVQPQPPPQPVDTASQRFRRTILPYTGAKSDGQLLNKHAKVSLNISKKREKAC